MGRAETLEGRQLDDRFGHPFEQYRQHHDVHGRSFPKAGVDLHVIAWHVGEQDALLLQSALPDQAFAQAKLLGQILALLVSIACLQTETGVVLFPFNAVEHAVLCLHQRRQFGQDELTYRQHFALALQYAREFRQVGFEPVLLGVLLGGVLEVADHFIDVVLEDRDLAFSRHTDRTREVALGHGGRHIGDCAYLGGQVGGELVDVIGEVLPGSRSSRHTSLTAQFAFDADFTRHTGHLIGEGR